MSNNDRDISAKILSQKKVRTVKSQKYNTNAGTTENKMNIHISIFESIFDFFGKFIMKIKDFRSAQFD